GRFAEYQKIIERYAAVCQVGHTSFCAPAHSQTARYAEVALDQVDGISIPDTLAESVVTPFEKRKDEITASLSNTLAQSSEQAVAAVFHGDVSPFWTEQILWE